MKRSICVSLALAIGGCHVGPPAAPPDQEQRAEAKSEHLAAEESRTAAEAELDRAEAVVSATEAKIRALADRERESAAKSERYAQTLAEAQEVGRTCEVEAGRLVELYDYLRMFAVEPRRDAAIEGLERCRGPVAAARRLEYARVRAELRQEFALAVEEQFDAENPQARGRLVAEVKGDVLKVSLRDFLEWRARDCQREVDAWCASTSLFASIELRGPDGTFRCRPGTSPAEYEAEQLRSERLDEPWVPVTSGVARLGGDLSPDESAELARLRRELVGEQQRVQAARAALGHAERYADDAEERLRSLERADESSVAVMSSVEVKKYKAMVYASVPVNLTGAVLVFVGLFSLMARQSIVDGKREFSSPGERDAALRRTTRNAIIGYAVGMPMVALGLALSILGARGPRSRRLTVSPDGIGIRF